jgi:hypothetical protein
MTRISYSTGKSLKPSDDAGAFVREAWNGTKMRWEEKNFSSETSEGWQERPVQQKMLK